MTFQTHLINGISLGSVYAIIALGYTMVYGIAKMLNFAHGDVIMVGAYICFFAVSSYHLPPAVPNRASLYSGAWTSSRNLSEPHLYKQTPFCGNRMCSYSLSSSWRFCI